MTRVHIIVHSCRIAHSTILTVFSFNLQTNILFRCCLLEEMGNLDVLVILYVLM